MNVDVLATVLIGVGVLMGVWRMVEGVRRDLAGRIAAVDQRVDAVNTRRSRRSRRRGLRR